MKEEFPKAYDAKSIDSKWYAFWEEGQFFTANPHSEKKPYCIVIPPPNVTGALHMGHALVDTLQDVLIRWKRMSGFEAAWIPGTDHAGIATQTVVERHLIATTGKRRKDFTRDEFLSHLWEWKEKNHHRILSQLKKLGCSCDWTRERFTLDEGNNQAVRTAFKKLFDEGLIYRGLRLVNWDPTTQTTLSDEEVDYEERQSFLWYFKYPLKDGTGYAHIATTRPETMLGDVAVAVNPKDERYKHLIGKTLVLPLMEREIPIIGDYLVDPEFGTGMVKVTPAHDFNDYQMGQTHSLPLINIMTPDGYINENGGAFTGLTMLKAREQVIAAMQNLGLVEKIEPHTLRVGLSYRSKAVIEPFLSKQWFIAMSGFAKRLRSVVEEGAFKIIPKQWESTYFHWIDNLKDWCISRQLWWGHRIPIWYNISNPEEIICYAGQGVPPEVAKAPELWAQDEDVLDTWFSSGLWPFAALGWPEKTPELAKFYPNSVLITGHDILFFWVARMVLMGDYLMEKAPFPETFLNGLIFAKSYWRQPTDGGIAYVSPEERLSYEFGKPQPKDVFSKWEKMSKTKGNIIDPIEVIDEYGTDAIRMALCASATQSREIDLDMRRFEEFKNFANKMWNGARFVFMHLDGDESQASALTKEEFASGLNEEILALEDRWILSLLTKTIAAVNEKLTLYAFDQATNEAYDFFWKEFCAYYLEIAKPVLFGKRGSTVERKNKQKLLAIILLHSIRLIHPMAPFITEELFQQLKKRLGDITAQGTIDPYTIEAIQALNTKACIIAPYPQVIRDSDLNQEINASFALIEELVYAIRNIRGEMKIPPGTATDVHMVVNENANHLKIIENNKSLIPSLVKVGAIDVHKSDPTDLGLTATAMVHGIKLMLLIPKELIEQEKARLLKEKERLHISLQKLSSQLDNVDFVKNAPPALIEKQRLMLQQNQEQLVSIEKKLQELK